MQNSKLVLAVLGLSLVATQSNVWAADPDQGGCNAGGEAALVGLLGAFAGNARNKGNADAINAFVGALSCIIFKSQTVQTKTNDQVLGEISKGGNDIICTVLKNMRLSRHLHTT